jgi:hypothetical protein
MPQQSRSRRDQRTVSVGTTDSPLLGPNPQRKAIIFVAPATNRYTVSFTGAAVLDQGLTIYPGQPPMNLDRDVYGDAFIEEVRAISAGVAQIVSVIDVFS